MGREEGGRDLRACPQPSFFPSTPGIELIDVMVGKYEVVNMIINSIQIGRYKFLILFGPKL